MRRMLWIGIVVVLQMESDIGDTSSRDEPASARSPTVGEVAVAANEALQRASVDTVGAAALYSGKRGLLPN